MATWSPSLSRSLGPDPVLARPPSGPLLGLAEGRCQGTWARRADSDQLEPGTAEDAWKPRSALLDSTTPSFVLLARRRTYASSPISWAWILTQLFLMPMNSSMIPSYVRGVSKGVTRSVTRSIRTRLSISGCRGCRNTDASGNASHPYGRPVNQIKPANPPPEAASKRARRVPLSPRPRAYRFTGVEGLLLEVQEALERRGSRQALGLDIGDGPVHTCTSPVPDPSLLSSTSPSPSVV